MYIIKVDIFIIKNKYILIYNKNLKFTYSLGGLMALNINKSMKNMGENNSQYAYRVLKDNIMNLNLSPGQILNENELIDILGISRTPIREAVFKLKDEALINVYPQKASIVAPIDLNRVEEAFFLRKIVEIEVLKLCCESCETKNLKELEKNIYLQEIVVNIEEDKREFFSLDNDFHSIIYNSVNKSRVWKTIKTFSSHYDRLRYLDIIEKTNLVNLLNQHKEIINIIKTKDISKVEPLLMKHLTNFRGELPVFMEKYGNFFEK